MIQTDICIAGLPIRVEHSFSGFSSSARPYSADGAAYRFCVSISEEDLRLERQKTEEEYRLEQKPVVSFSDRSLEGTAIHRKIAEQLPLYDAVVFHGSAVAVDGRAYLFTARSGVGKTTHSRLWLKNIENSYIVNGDKPVLRLMNGQVYACGTPWTGKEQLGCNEMVPLSAICLLERGETNSIREIGFSEAFPVLLNQTYHPAGREAMTATLDMIKKIGSLVRFYRLSCNMEPEAAIVSYEGMCHGDL